MFTNDSIEIIEENLISHRALVVCQQITSQCDTLWCFSLRKCLIHNVEFEKLIRTLKKCKLLRYLNFNLNLINSFERVTYLATLLPGLNYLDTLCLHSSNLKDDGLRVLYYSLINNEHFHSLDIGDCQLTDDSVPIIKELIHRKEHSRGLFELIISCNQKITSAGWSQILIAVAAAADLKYFHMDYNCLDDSCGYLICAIMTSNHSLKVLDLEHTGLSNKTAILLLYLVKTYCVTVKTLNLLHNKIDECLLNEIQHHVQNEYNVEKVGILNREVTKGVPLNNENQIYDIKMRDQLKMDEYVQNGLVYNDGQKFECVMNDYQRILERDYREVKEKYVKVYRPGSIEQEQEDLLEPTEDMRFKHHIVLPFNIR